MFRAHPYCDIIQWLTVSCLLVFFSFLPVYMILRLCFSRNSVGTLLLEPQEKMRKSKCLCRGSKYRWIPHVHYFAVRLIMVVTLRSPFPLNGSHSFFSRIILFLFSFFVVQKLRPSSVDNLLSVSILSKKRRRWNTVGSECHCPVVRF